LRIYSRLVDVTSQGSSPAGPRCIISSTCLACNSGLPPGLYTIKARLLRYNLPFLTLLRSHYRTRTIDPIPLHPGILNDVDQSSASLPSPPTISSIPSLRLPFQQQLKMSGYYPGHNVPPQYYNVDPNIIPTPSVPHGPPIIIPQGSYAPGLPDNPFHPGVPGPFVQYTDTHLQPAFLDQHDDVSGPLGSMQGANARARRRPAPGEQVKHRRTRSGCFTCRQRRVKVTVLFSFLTTQTDFSKVR
jgi:hypothetical protein